MPFQISYRTGVLKRLLKGFLNTSAGTSNGMCL